MGCVGVFEKALGDVGLAVSLQGKLIWHFHQLHCLGRIDGAFPVDLLARIIVEFKRRFLGFAALAAALPISVAQAGRCGPFDVFEGNEYCVSCETGTKKVYQCPGGEVGMVAVGVGNPGCSVSYYSSSCRENMALLSTEAKSRQDHDYNSVKLGHPSLSQKGDEVIIRMKRSDFDKLMQKQ